jgi:hypothetical protein
MNNLLQLLIYSMNTLDGHKDSAMGIINLQYKQAHKKLRLSRSTGYVSAKEEQKMMRIIKHRLMRKTLMKYKVLRIRTKISYHAFMNIQTILHCFVNRILDSYDLLNGQPLIFKDDALMREFHQSIELGAAKAFRFIIEFNCKLGRISKEVVDKLLVKQNTIE